MLKKAVILTILLITLMVYGNEKYIHHDLNVTLEPNNQSIHVVDTIYLPLNLKNEKIHFLLHGNLSILSPSPDLQINREEGELKSEFFGINTAQFEIKKEIPINHYSIKFLKESQITPKGRQLVLDYRGKIHHPIKQVSAEYARGFSETPGIISKQGAYLSGATFWIPWFNDNLVTFKMKTHLPQSWDVISEGDRTLHKLENGIRYTTWNSPQPMEEVHLVAAPFKEYGLKVGKTEIMAFLRSNDESLANKYLETTGQYLGMYEKLIGPYPFSKFALIENFWETGYGMSSFTLLGPKVIRFPFILHSSYPHELLHNWWGNSVFVDYNAGNWCEGITAYLADHLIKEQRNQGIEYRKTTLQDYTHYAAGKEAEFPLTQFKARYDSLSSSIGYGKSLMMYHMLRQQIGDSLFKKTLQHFYKENKYKKSTFADFKKSAEHVTGKNFDLFFQQWIERTGIPELRLKETHLEKKGEEWQLQCTLEQIQPDSFYNLRIPAAITLKGQQQVEIKNLNMTKKIQEYEFTFSVQPVRIDIDPEFDVMRKLHVNEIPPTLSGAFGAPDVLILLPSGAPQEFLKAYRKLAEKWANESNGKIVVKQDSEISTIPNDRSIWLMGWENLHRKKLQEGIAFYGAGMDNVSLTLGKKQLFPDRQSIVAVLKNKSNPEQVVVLLSIDRTAALPGLGRKLPHYGKYSYLAFEGNDPTNMLKGQWPVVNSPLSAPFSLEKSQFNRPIPMGELPKRKALGRLAPLFSAQRMMDHIGYLAGKGLEGRGLGSKGLENAAHYIANAFKNAGLKPGGDQNSYFQTWEDNIAVPTKQMLLQAGKGDAFSKKSPPKKITLRNVIAEIPGTNPSFKGEFVIICAHYDHLGMGWPDVHRGDEGKIHFGADDNASGVAVMLELASTLGKSFKPERTIIFVAFTGEESGQLGSKHYMDTLEKKQMKKIMAVINLDTVGRLEEKEKLMVIGNKSAREWRFIFMGVGYTTGIQTQLIQQDLDASDQVTFVKAGIPGIQLFSGPHQDYHRPSDTPDKIDAKGLVKVASVAKEVTVYLSERETPLTFQGERTGTSQPSASSGGERRVGTGLMPDFSFSGKGVKVGMITPDSAAEKAGLKKGDIIIKLGDVPIADLRQYSSTLKTFKPGDKTTVVYLREGKEYSHSITLSAR